MEKENANGQMVENSINNYFHKIRYEKVCIVLKVLNTLDRGRRIRWMDQEKLILKMVINTLDR